MQDVRLTGYCHCQPFGLNFGSGAEPFSPSSIWHLVEKGQPMIRRSFLLVVLGLVCARFQANALSVQKFQDKTGRAGDCNTSSLIQPALKDYAHYIALWRVSGTAAGSGPRTLVDDKFLRPIAVIDETISGNISARSQRLDDAKGKSGESNWRSVWRLESIEGHGVDFYGDFILGFTDSQIQAFIDVTVSESEPFDVERGSVSFPSVVGYVDRHDARNRTLKSNLLEVCNHMGSRDEVTQVVDEKPSAIGQLAIELPLKVHRPAQYGYDGFLYAINRVDENVVPILGGQEQGNKKQKDKKKEKTAVPHTSGNMMVQNDGRFMGCIVSHESSSSISLSCPQIDSVGAHKEAPQQTKRDPSTPPPSRE
jgi:hypothetical protein